MHNEFEKVLRGYRQFREKYTHSDSSLMRSLALNGQNPKVMMIACSDSRVDPGILLQCDPGDLFVVRNIANIIPPYENDEHHHGTSAALEFGICYLDIQHVIVLGHSACAGIQARLNKFDLEQDDFITNWISQITVDPEKKIDADDYARQSLVASYHNCLTYPWIKKRIDKKQLQIHLWFLDIGEAVIENYNFDSEKFVRIPV